MACPCQIHPRADRRQPWPQGLVPRHCIHRRRSGLGGGRVGEKSRGEPGCPGVASGCRQGKTKRLHNLGCLRATMPGHPLGVQCFVVVEKTLKNLEPHPRTKKTNTANTANGALAPPPQICETLLCMNEIQCAGSDAPSIPARRPRTACPPKRRRRRVDCGLDPPNTRKTQNPQALLSLRVSHV